MSYLLLLLSVLFIGQAQARPTQKKGLALTVKGSVKIPANQIIFHINVNAEGKSPQKAYSLQKNG